MEKGTRNFLIVFAVLIVLAVALFFLTRPGTNNSGLTAVSTGFIEPKGVPSDGNAKVTIIEFSDFQCPYCSKVQPALNKIMDEYGEQVSLYFRNFPLSQIHPDAANAAIAAVCANEQGKFWEYHDVLFEKQDSLSKGSLKDYAAQLQLNFKQFVDCFDSQKYAEKVAEDLTDGLTAGVQGTPTFFINGEIFVGARSYEEFKAAIESELAS